MAVLSFINAVNRTVAVTPSDRGEIYHTAVVNPMGKRAESVPPLRTVFIIPAFELPLSRHSIVVSFSLTISSVGTFPQGTSGIMPDQVPANLLGGAGEGVDTVRDGVAVRSVFGSVTRFGFGFAECSGAGVGLSGTS
jgi:hypothetical protein